MTGFPRQSWYAEGLPGGKLPTGITAGVMDGRGLEPNVDYTQTPIKEQ